MPEKITRLELVIIVAALVVLLFSNRPPQPGSAEMRADTGPATEDMQNSLAQMEPAPPSSPDRSGRATVRTDRLGAQPSTHPEPDNVAMEPVPQPQTKQKRMGMVDARQCDSLKYPNVMYGEIKVTRVWNGTTFEWRRVCEIKEKDGTISVWSFDKRHEGVILSEIEPDQVPRY